VIICYSCLHAYSLTDFSYIAFDTLVCHIGSALIIYKEAPSFEVAVTLRAGNTVSVCEILGVATFIWRSQGGVVDDCQGFQKDFSGIRWPVLRNGVECAENGLENNLIIDRFCPVFFESRDYRVVLQEVVVILLEVGFDLFEVRVVFVEDQVPFKYLEARGHWVKDLGRGGWLLLLLRSRWRLRRWRGWGGLSILGRWSADRIRLFSRGICIDNSCTSIVISG